jgi:hypothetical protein
MTNLMKRTPALLAALLLAPLAALHAADAANLRCEYQNNPLGIDVEKPQLSWVMEDGGQKTEDRGRKQTAYQILVASTPELLAKDKGDLWDSGKVESDQSIHVEYAGKPLESQMRCFWKVRVWTSRTEVRGRRSEGMGIAANGQGRRIGPWECSSRKPRLRPEAPA